MPSWSGSRPCCADGARRSPGQARRGTRSRCCRACGRCRASALLLDGKALIPPGFGLCWRIRPWWSVWHRSVLEGVDGRMGMVPGGRRCRCVPTGSRRSPPRRRGWPGRRSPRGAWCCACAMRLACCLPTKSSPSCSRHGVVQRGHRRGWRWCWCWEFVEGLTDRQAADAVRARLDWKYALGLDLCDPGFDASVLTEFRARLLADGQAERLLTLMLDRLRERGLLRGGGRQRTDATHVRMAVRDLHRLEQVFETLRAALEALAVVAA